MENNSETLLVFENKLFWNNLNIKISQ